MSDASPTSWIGRPVRRDPALAGATALVLAAGAAAQGASTLEVIGLATLGLPLVVRTRWPVAVLGVVAGGAVAYSALVPALDGVILPMLIALYTVGVRGSRRRSLWLAAGLLPAAVLFGLLVSPEDGDALGRILETASQLGFALAVGEAVRSRREYVEAVRDRAEHAAHERELEARRRVDEERVRLARDVHDVVAHSIATITTQAAVGAHLGRDEPDRALEALISIRQVSHHALQDLRHALGALRDPTDETVSRPTPSVEAIPELVQQARTAGVGVDLRMRGEPAELPAAVQVAVYRIVQEGLTNVMRHASGARATVDLAVSDDEVVVEVRDDGGGPSPPRSTVGTRSGLTGMSERARALGGSLQTGARPGGGFGVRAVMPIDRGPP